MIDLVNVQVIENAPDDPEEQEVVRLYREGLSMKKIGELFDGSETWVRRILYEARDNGEVEIRPRYSVNPKNYWFNKHNGRYHVYKQINGKSRQFGTYSDEATAKKVVEELRKVEWDKSQLERIKAEIGVL